MADLLAGAADEFREGSMKIAYQGGNMQMGVQVRMIDSERKLIWAEQFVYGSKFLSNRLEGVWWLPFSQSETRLAVSNTSSQTLTATIDTDGTAPAQSGPYQVTLAPWETRMLDIMGDVVGNENGHLKEKGGVSITHTGAPGGILARMYIAKPNRGYSASIPFVDPEATGSQKWHGAGLRLRVDGDDLDSVLVARNNGNQPTTITGRIPYTRPNGNMDEVSIPARLIPANSTRVIDLDNLIDQADVPNAVKFAGIEVNYSTPKGTVTTSVQSISHNGEHVFQVPMLDPTKLQSSAGGYPWKADGDFRTLLYIKNETDVTRKYTAEMLFPTGGGYNVGLKEIKPGETVVVDFKKLRDEQTPDGMGTIIPLDLDHAQLAFSAVGPVAKVLSGRAEQMSSSNGIASTYACVNCCDNSVYDGWITPDDGEIPFGDSLMYDPVQQDQNCSGALMTPYFVFADFWVSSDTSVATVNSFGQATGVGAGTTYLTAKWNAGYWDAMQGFCHHNDVEMEETGLIAVAPTVTDVTSDEGTKKITEVVGSPDLIHFVTPKGSGNVTLTATLSSDHPQILNDISWEGASESSSNAAVATLGRGSAERKTVKIKYKSVVIKELRVWIVWSTIATTDIALGSYSISFGNPQGPGYALDGGYSFEHTIQPASLITDSNRPDLSGANAEDPPDGDHPIFGEESLAGGADKKWDNSRQIRFKILNPDGLLKNDTAFSILSAFPADLTAFPASDVTGNDDTLTSEETNDPYGNGGKLTGTDFPRTGVVHRAGANGNTFEFRLQFREFTRVELEGTWFRISDFKLWKMHLRFIKQNGAWTNNSSVRALNNDGF